MLTPEYLEGLPDPVIELYQQAEDAILVDTSEMTIEEVVAAIKEMIRR